VSDREQLALFPAFTANEPGDARVVLGAPLRANIAARHTIALSIGHYLALSSPVSRRLYRLLEVRREDGHAAWRVPLATLAEQLPLTQRYPSHLQRVLQPAHEMLVHAGIVREARIRQQGKEWVVDYALGAPPVAAAGG
jgi:hypothetical protein